MFIFIFIICLIYTAICALMWVKQRSLVFFPDKGILSPASYGLDGFEDRIISSQDGTRIQLWVHPAKEGYPTLLYLHGNGGHLGYRSGYFSLFSKMGFGVVGVEYRGYGKSEGAPNEEGFAQDARAALRYATDTLAIPPSRIIAFGESIGSGVAVRLAAEHPIGGLVLQSPFTSAVNRAAELYPWLPVRLLMRDPFDSEKRIAQMQSPLLILHGERDTIIPVAHGKALFAKANEPKQFILFPSINHNDFPPEEVAKALFDFAIMQGLISEHG